MKQIRMTQDQRMINAIRQLLGIGPLYGKTDRRVALERYSTTTGLTDGNSSTLVGKFRQRLLAPRGGQGIRKSA